MQRKNNPIWPGGWWDVWARRTGPSRQQAPFPEWSQVLAVCGAVPDPIGHRTMVLQYSCLIFFLFSIFFFLE